MCNPFIVLTHVVVRQTIHVHPQHTAARTGIVYEYGCGAGEYIARVGVGDGEVEHGLRAGEGVDADEGSLLVKFNLNPGRNVRPRDDVVKKVRRTLGCILMVKPG